jgi:hypothetical protein
MAQPHARSPPGAFCPLHRLPRVPRGFHLTVHHFWQEHDDRMPSIPPPKPLLTDAHPNRCRDSGSQPLVQAIGCPNQPAAEPSLRTRLARGLAPSGHGHYGERDG